MKVVKDFGDRDQELVVAPQSICEFWVVATRPTDVNGFGWSPNRTIDWVYYFEFFFKLLPDAATVYSEWKTRSKYDTCGKPAHDARLVAFMNIHNINSILTFNVNDFARYDITVLDPRTLTQT